MNCAEELVNLIAAECNNPVVAGTHGEVTLLPYNAIDRGATTVVDGVITSLVLKAGAKGSTYDSLDNSTFGAVSLNTGAYVNTVQQDITLRIFVKNENVKAFVNKFLNSRVVAIPKNKEMGKEGEMMYEAYGFDAGLKLNTLTGDTSMADGVVYELVAGNDDTSKEKTLPKSIWAGTLADTETMLATLTA